MQSPAPNRPLELSQKLYDRLLAAYPRQHRQEYGGLMAQLFRDQCREAWNSGQTLGLAALWLRIIPDLIKTSFIERCTNLNPGKFMSDKLASMMPSRHSPTSVFFTVFTIVFLLVFLVSVIITFILPESYASTARIKVEADAMRAIPAAPADHQDAYDPYFIQTTFEIIQSQLVLSNVVSKLNLNVSWGKKYFAGETLKTTKTMEILKRRMALKPVRNTQLIDITVFSDDRQEAAVIANAVAHAYIDYRTNVRKQVAAGGLKVLEVQLDESAAKIQASTARLDHLRSELKIGDNNASALDPAPTLTEQMAQTYNQQIIEGERTFKPMQAQLEALKALPNDKLREVLPTVTNDSLLTDLLGKLHTAEQELSGLTNNYAPANPKIVDSTAMINTLNRQIDNRVAGIMTGLENEVNSKKAAVEALATAMAQAKTNDQQAQTREQPYWEEKRALERQLNFHQILATKIAAEKAELEIPAFSAVQIVDTAVPGTEPVKPNKPLNIIIGALMGILLGGGCGTVAALISMRMGKRKGVVVPGAAR